MKPAECKFASLAAAKGYEIHKSGWPDFLITDNGRAYAVEVKSTADRLRESQRGMFQALERSGMRVFVWWEPAPERLIPWKKFARMTEQLDASPMVRKTAKTVGEWLRPLLDGRHTVEVPFEVFGD